MHVTDVTAQLNFTYLGWLTPSTAGVLFPVSLGALQNILDMPVAGVGNCGRVAE